MYTQKNDVVLFVNTAVQPPKPLAKIVTFVFHKILWGMKYLRCTRH